MVWLSDQNSEASMKFRCTAMSAGQVASVASGIFLIVLTVCAMGVPGFAQSTTGRILGSVSDQSGAAVTGATVVVTSVERGTSRALTTDEAGAYVAPDLAPGTYKIHVEAKGFKSTERPNVVIEVATDVRADFALQPGQVTETVVVQEEVPLVNTTSATLGGTLSNQEINDLPLNGRNYENLLQLRPGVMRYPGGGFSTTSTDGLRAEDNAYFVEGLFNSEPFSGQGIINGAGIAGDSATILPIDAIQEFNVQENPPAEYGWKPGAVINVGLKSGTNSLHGTAFAFGRDGVLDARNYFNVTPAAKTPRTLEQFGGSVGGAIVKDKAFFFGAYEGQRYDVGNSYSVTTPTTVGLPTPATPTCTSVSGDCANSIPNAIADLLANDVPISHASQLISGCTVSASGAVSLQRYWISHQQHADHQRRAGIPQQCWRRQRDWEGGLQHQSNATASAECTSSATTREGSRIFQSCNRSGSPTIHTRAQVVRRKLDLDSQRELGERSPSRLQPPLPAYAAGRSEYVRRPAYGLEHRSERSVHRRTAPHRLRRRLLSRVLAASSGRSSRGRIRSPNSSITFPSRQENIPSNLAANCTAMT